MISDGLLKKLDRLPPDIKDAFIIFADEMEEKSRSMAASREDFSQLRNIVGELAEAQKRTEHKIEELAEAQKRTEHKVEELAEAQKRTEHRVEELAEAQKELTEAQNRTETKVEALTEAQKELTEAQKRTENSVRELADAQRKTEKTVQDVKKQLGGLSAMVGYGLEDRIIPYVFDFGEKEFGVDVSSVERKHVFYPDGRSDEINIYAEGSKAGRQAFIFGECKAHLGKKDVSRFAKTGERLKEVLPGDHYLFMVGNQIHPEVETYAEARFPHVSLVKSYEFELKYRKRKVG
jgi:vacuolar-type H+-ATPase subunit I/STV1